jgi:hypothetical protein
MIGQKTFFPFFPFFPGVSPHRPLHGYPIGRSVIKEDIYIYIYISMILQGIPSKLSSQTVREESGRKSQTGFFTIKEGAE